MPEFYIWAILLINQQEEMGKNQLSVFGSRGGQNSPLMHVPLYHIRHFIKIRFVNKGIEFNNLPSIFKDKSVISTIPTYFEKKESFVISTINLFIYNKLVTELDIAN